jgi:ABC-type multidrug transport system fused ATPase/permease subunit
MSILFWLIGLLGVAGGGLWVAALFVPAAALLLQQILAFLKECIAFLRTPVGQVVAVLVLIALAWFAGDRHRARLDAAADAAAQAQLEQAAQKRDANQAQLSDADAAQRAAYLEQQHLKDQETIDDYRKKLATAADPARACALTPDDALRLR